MGNFFLNLFKNILTSALKSYIKWLLIQLFLCVKKFEKIEKIGYHSNFNFKCNTEGLERVTVYSTEVLSKIIMNFLDTHMTIIPWLDISTYHKHIKNIGNNINCRCSGKNNHPSLPGHSISVIICNFTNNQWNNKTN